MFEAVYVQNLTYLSFNNEKMPKNKLDPSCSFLIRVKRRGSKYNNSAFKPMFKVLYFTCQN